MIDPDKPVVGNEGVKRGLVRRLLEGENSWGSLKTHVSWDGGERVHFSVYLPGSTASQRRNARLWSAWCRGSGLLWLATFAVLCTVTDPGIAAALAAGLLGAGWLSASRVTRNRCAVLHLKAAQGVGAPTAAKAGEFKRIISAAVGLQAAEEALRTGEITAAQYEASWLTIFRWLASGDRQAAGTG